jgi:long-chain acyl-CoA synthetase
VIKYVKKMVPSYKLPNAYSFHQALDLGSDNRFKPETCMPDDLLFLQYTGGTTGISKGAELTHGNLVANTMQTLEWLRPSLVEGEEVAICALPLYHIFCLMVNALVIVSFGGTNVMITNPRDIPAFIKTLRANPFSIFLGLNTLFNALMNNPDFMKIDFSRVKISVAGGMALQVAVAQRWMKMTGTRLVEGYGLTETSPVAVVNPIDGTDRIGTIGLPVPNTDIKLCDDDGKEVPLGKSGEIWIKGPQVMRGYWKQPEETARVMAPGGWFKSGDIGVFDADGFIKIVDRKKDMILVSGFNVYPNEIEDVVAHHPKVLEVAAIGVPDAKSTEAVKIFVVPKDPSLTESELMAYCKQNLTGYKLPKHIEFRKDLPKSPVGKILRRELREIQT